jgi:hypothetical protein
MLTVVRAKGRSWFRWRPASVLGELPMFVALASCRPPRSGKKARLCGVFRNAKLARGLLVAAVKCALPRPLAVAI